MYRSIHKMEMLQHSNYPPKCFHEVRRGAINRTQHCRIYLSSVRSWFPSVPVASHGTNAGKSTDLWPLSHTQNSPEQLLSVHPSLSKNVCMHVCVCVGQWTACISAVSPDSCPQPSWLLKYDLSPKHEPLTALHWFQLTSFQVFLRDISKTLEHLVQLQNCRSIQLIDMNDIDKKYQVHAVLTLNIPQITSICNGPNKQVKYIHKALSDSAEEQTVPSKWQWPPVLWRVCFPCRAPE